MIPFPLSFAVDAADGIYHGDPALLSEPVESVTIDSRSVKPRTLFVPVVGKVHDGHSFIQAAMSAGALCTYTDRPLETEPYILVKDTTDAFQRLSEAYLRENRVTVVGVTGSAGKTSTKEMLYSVLSRHFRAFRTPGNLNNQTGVPQAVLQIEKDHEVAILELGTNHPGEIRSLSRIIRPDICVITNIGVAHIEFFGSRENIFRGKAEILEYMQPDGFAVVNGDDDFLPSVPNAVTYGIGADNRFAAKNIRELGLNGSEFDIRNADLRCHFLVPAPGRHMIYNALAATAVGTLLGMPAEEIAEGIAGYRPFSGRLEILRTQDYTILNDTYNANPGSMKSSIDVLRYADGRKVCILGDMLELGENSPRFHEEVGRYAAEHGTDLILCVGVDARYLCEGARAVLPDASRYYPDCDSLLDALPGLLNQGDTILIKASRGMHFERIVSFIANGFSRA